MSNVSINKGGRTQAYTKFVTIYVPFVVADHISVARYMYCSRRDYLIGMFYVTCHFPKDICMVDVVS